MYYAQFMYYARSRWDRGMMDYPGPIVGVLSNLKWSEDKGVVQGGKASKLFLTYTQQNYQKHSIKDGLPPANGEYSHTIS